MGPLLHVPPATVLHGRLRPPSCLFATRSYAVLVDGEEKKAGSLFEDFEPAFNPPETIPDPEDKKPADWVDEAQ